MRTWQPTARTVATLLILGLVVAVAGACATGRRTSTHQPSANAGSTGNAPPTIQYNVSLTRPQTQTATITMRLVGLNQSHVDVSLPTWRPGRYIIIDPAGTIRRISAVDGNDRSRAIKKINKSTWRVDTDNADAITVQYELFANSLNDRTRHIDDTHAFLSGDSVFLYVEQWRNQPVTVHLDIPEHWRVSTGLQRVRDHTYHAPDYDILVDSPLEIGEHEALHFDVDGKPHEIVIWGEAKYDAERLRNDFAAIVREQVEIFGSMPYDKYVFMIHCAAGLGGGTEHINSTIMQIPPRSLEGSLDNSDAYKRFLGLVSHEMFHTWNVKQFRPAGLSPYDYQKENYTTLLWLVEGTTSYYDDLILARAGLLSEDEYFKRLSNAVDGFRNQPGRKIQSLADSSYDAWIKYNKPTADRVNSTVSFYRKGALVSLLLDMQIRQRTGGDASLDDVIQKLYEQYPHGSPGFTRDDLQQILENMTGSAFNSFFAKYIDGTDALPLVKALADVGLSLTFESSKEDESNKDEQSHHAHQPYLGVNLRGTTVRSVLTDGPANNAGIVVGDEIIAIDNRKFHSGTLNDRLDLYEPGDEITITTFRRDRMRTVNLVLAAQPKGDWTIQRTDQPREQQMKAYQSWLGHSWQSNDDHTESSSSK